MRSPNPVPLLLLAAVGCGDGAPVPPLTRPSALLITLDTTRADALGCYGGRADITPELDALARRGVRFERAYTVTPLTLPAHASILTGLYPPRHGLRNNGQGRLPASAATLAERAQEAGIETAAFVASVVLDAGFGLDQGFDRYVGPAHVLEQTTSHYSDVTGADIVADVAAWLAARDPTRPFFAWVHLWDPHGPWEPPPRYLELAPDHPYLGDVAQADAAVGELVALLDAHGLAQATTILVVADHGEAFWEHGEFSHGTYCYDTTMRVPLILCEPGGARAGEVVNEVVSVVDVVPTLAEALELPPLAGLDGQSRLGRAPTEPGGAYLESYYGFLTHDWSPLAGWVDDAGKYLHSSAPQFFRSGDEDVNVLGEVSELERYRQAIAAVAARPALEPDAGLAPGIDEELREQIRSLGYSGVGVETILPHPLDPGGRPAPASRVGVQKRSLEALGLFNRGDYASAEAIHRRILAANPNNWNSLERLGIALIRQTRHAEAVVPLQRLADAGRETASSAVNLGVCMRVAGEVDHAIECFQRALALDASQVRAARHLVDLYAATGDAQKQAFYAKRVEELLGAR